jgi:TolA-binding protein
LEHANHIKTKLSEELSLLTR